MYDTARPADTARPSDALQQRLRTSWWILALAGVAALGLAVSIRPRPPQAARAASVTAPKAAALSDAAPAPDEAGPVSLTDVVGKASLGLLLVYAVGWGLVKVRRGGWPPRLCALGREELPRRLQLAESLALGHQQATLHLVEVDGTVLLLGSSVDQVSVLWSSTPAPPSAQPVPQPAETSVAPSPSRPVAVAVGRKPLGGPPVRHEADWEQERSRLIRSLVNQDEVA